jgi:predicted lipopolysaccharide heptosyltransferase III
VNILLLQLKRIGDLVLTTPLIAALREKFPDAVITLIVSRENAALLPAITGVDRSFVIQRKLSDVKIFRAVSREEFDYCIDLTGNDRSALLAYLSGAQKRVASNWTRVQSKIRTGAYNEFVEDRVSNMHTVDFHFTLLESLGIRDASPAIKLQLPSAARDKANEIRHTFKIDNPFVIFHPGSARIEKFWEARRWADAIKHAQLVLKLNAVLTSGDSTLEQQHIAEIRSKVPDNAVVDLAGKIDLLTLTALIEQARLLVTVDSAPMHLAAAVHTPQVVLFGPTNPFHWRPRERDALILQGRSTSPVVEFTPEQTPVSMNDISTDAVINAMNSLLSAPAVQAS